MKFLGIDYGSKRIGLAISDEDFNFAFPLETLGNDWAKFKMRMGEIIISENISGIVLGLPLSFKNVDTPETRKVRTFAKKIEKEFGLGVIFENEALSTKQVLKSQSAPRQRRDQSAAALILQSYLDRIRK